MKHEMSSCWRESAGPVLANTQYQSACTTPDIQHLVPVSTQSSPSRTALVRMPDDVAAGLRLGEPEAGALLAGRDRRARSCCFCSSLPGDQHRAGRQPREQQHQRGGVGVLRDLFDRDREAEDPGARRRRTPRGCTRPSSPGRGTRSKRSWGYSPVVDLPRPGRTFSCAACGRWPGARRAPGEFEVHEVTPRCSSGAGCRRLTKRTRHYGSGGPVAGLWWGRSRRLCCCARHRARIDSVTPRSEGESRWRWVGSSARRG